MTRAKKNSQQFVVVRMPPELHDAIKARAAADERTMAQAVRHAVRHYLDGCPAHAAP
ncbi:MAG: hypothetical protein M3N28_05490 [Actinomycetota bacterium]|nr:hypothetical protein [Actinomycetota bacterium]